MLPSERTNVRQFIIELLKDYGCRGIHQIGSKNINGQCPFHKPHKNTSAFGISFEDEEKGYPFRCFACGVTGTIVSLIAYLKSCS
jgi:hypothetical protein